MNTSPQELSSAHLSTSKPFPGLRPFDFDDHPFFFGRDDHCYALYRLLDQSRFVAVVGSSGSGKSSLVRAGLLPILAAENTEMTERRKWRWIVIRPGEAPISRLADAMAALQPNPDKNVAAAHRERIDFALRRSSFGLNSALKELDDKDKIALTIIVDQFEELFRYSSPNAARPKDRSLDRGDEAAQFVQLLLEGARDIEGDIRILITMRSDFIGDCARFYRLPEAISSAQFLVPSLMRDQLEEIIRLPLRIAQASIEPELVERLLVDAPTDLDQLPVLQHCLQRLWDRASLGDKRLREASNSRHHLSVPHYEAVGGVARCLSQHGNEVLADLSGHEETVEKIFRALAEVDNEGRPIRRALAFERLQKETGIDEPKLRFVLDHLRKDGCSFLTPSLSAVRALSPDSRIDVGHEALLRRWEKIGGSDSVDFATESRNAGWLRDEEDDGRVYRGLIAMVDLGAELLRGKQLHERVSWWKSPPRTRAWTERYGGGWERVDKYLNTSYAVFEAKQEAAAAAARRTQLITLMFCLFVALIVFDAMYRASP